jgi:D-alanyl-D-alanine carboxypeptidase
VREELQAIVDRDVGRWEAMPGRMLAVLAPGVDVEVAAGLADVATGEPLTPGNRFRIASVTKPFVAAAALRLWEDGWLDLDEPIERLVADETAATLRGGVYDPSAITTRHLLTHTSGVYDFAADAYGSMTDDGFVAACRADPRHRWTRREQLRFAVDHGQPYGEPGSVFVYSDTGANLAGEIVERCAGMTLGAAIRELVGFERLGLRRTYHESVEPEPSDLPAVAEQYEGDYDVARYDPSVDLWGGGGLVSTCRDLALFFRALLGGDVFREAATLDVMRAVPDAPALHVDDPDAANEAANTGMFLFRRRYGRWETWGHSGYWGTVAATCPELDVNVVAQDGQAWMPGDYRKGDVVGEVLEMAAGGRR